MDLQVADYALLGLVTVMAVTGLFRGFSGTLAFLVAVAAAAAAAALGWRLSVNWLEAVWMRGAATLVATLLAFGLVRLLVKKTVNGLLAQPSDAVFGFLVGAVTGSLVIVAWAYSGWMLEYSSLASEVAQYVR